MNSRTSCRSGWRLIPSAAWFLAAAALIAVPPAIHAVFMHNHEHGFILTFEFCLLLGALEAGWLLFLGYVYGDARRRGMNAIAWTVVAVVIPNLIGFLLYFVLRKAVLLPCPQCGQGVAPRAAFCSACGYQQPLTTTWKAQRNA
jgi:Phospholipase_D-nuclease N-terminal